MSKSTERTALKPLPFPYTGHPVTYTPYTPSVNTNIPIKNNPTNYPQSPPYTTSPAASLSGSPTYASLNKLPPVPPRNPTTSSNVIQNRLQKVIQTKMLEKCYSTVPMELIQKVQKVEFNSLARKLKINVEACYDLAALSLYRIVVLVDDSGSMSFEDDGRRIDDMKHLLGQIAFLNSQFNEEGITVKFLNSDHERIGLKSEQEVSDLITDHNFFGITPLGTSLEQRVLLPCVYDEMEAGTFVKPLLVFIITDGAPSGEDDNKVLDVIDYCQNYTSHRGYGHSISYQFIQVGNDAESTQFLRLLDDNKSTEDIIDTVSVYDQNLRDVDLLKLFLGSIVDTYDKK
ncbi:hypothetical protein BC833DRAFT_571164, partial [Globomyces pollinis-pini]